MRVVFLDSKAFDSFEQTSLLPSNGAFIVGETVPEGSWADINKFLVTRLAELEWYAAAIGKRECRFGSIQSVHLARNCKPVVLSPDSFDAKITSYSKPISSLLAVVRWS